MDVYDAPDAETDDIDLNAARPGWMAVIGGSFVAVNGLTLAIAGLQLIVVVNFYSIAWIVPWVMVLLGVISLGVGGVITRARDWAAFIGAGLSLLIALVTVGWSIFAAFNGFISLLSLIAAGLAVLTVPMSLAAVPSALSSSRARRKLYS